VRDISKEDFLRRLKSQEFRDRLKKVHDDGKLKFVGVHTKAWPYWMDCFKIIECKNKDYEGKTVGEIARMKNRHALELMFDMILEDPDVSWAQAVEPRAQPAYLKAVVQSPYFMPSTDSVVSPAKLKKGEPANPNSYGLYPHYIRRYVKDEAVISLEEAIRKATSLPARVIGLKDRGTIKEGAFADIVLFDSEEIRDMNDFLNPDKPPEGIEYVLVNGTIVYENMTHTGKKPGKVLRHKF
jgi:N-acyl-D-aspartate/D-glutamate deacylase